MQKALLYALLQPHEELKKLQDTLNFTKLMVWQEELKTLPFGAVWDEYLRRQNCPGDQWFSAVEKYEAEVLRGRS
jgi:L-rhamnose isomerase